MADLDTYDDNQRSYDGMSSLDHLHFLSAALPEKPTWATQRPARPITTITSTIVEHQSLTHAAKDDRDYGAARDRSRSPQLDRDGDVRVRDEPSNGRPDR